MPCPDGWKAGGQDQHEAERHRRCQCPVVTEGVVSRGTKWSWSTGYKTLCRGPEATARRASFLRQWNSSEGLGRTPHN